MILSLKTQAIKTALSGNWNNAVTLNEEVLKVDPKDVDTLNRLAFAYTMGGHVKNAKATYQKVLALDIKNPIALKNLKRLNSDKSSTFVQHKPLLFSRPNESLFLEESGKTKIVELVNIAPARIVIHLNVGEEMILRIKRLKIFILDKNQKYIGVLPDNIGKRLIRFLKGGNIYVSYIKSADKNKVAIFIKETKRSSRFKNQASFLIADKSHFVLQKNHPAIKLEDELDDEENNYELEESL